MNSRLIPLIDVGLVTSGQGKKGSRSVGVVTNFDNNSAKQVSAWCMTRQWLRDFLVYLNIVDT